MAKGVGCNAATDPLRRFGRALCADTRIHRGVAAQGVQYIFDPKTPRQIASDEGAQDAFAQGGLRVGRSGFMGN